MAVKQPSLIQSAFQGNAKNTVAAVDAYGEKASDVQNAYRSLTQGYFDRIMKGLGTNNKSLLKAVKVLKSSNFSNLSSIDKLDSLLKTQGLSVNTISTDMKSVISNAMGQDKTFIDHMQVKIGDTYRSIQNGDYKTVSGFTEMARGLLGDTVIGQMIDQEAELAYYSTMLTQADACGMPEAVDLILGKTKDSNTRKNVLTRYGAGYSGTSVSSLETMIRQYPNDISALTAKRPDLALVVLQSYTFDSGTTPDQYPAKLTQLIYVLDHLMPNWLYTTRGTQEIINLTVFSRASKDAVTLFQTDAKYMVPATIGGNYPTKTASSIMKAMYPHIVV